MTAALWIGGLLALALVRAPHIRRSLGVRVAVSCETRGDRALVALVALGIVLPILWLCGLLAFAETRESRAQTVMGTLALTLGLYLLHHSHVDLGANWSNTLALKEQHELVTRGIYRRVRHPMYLALLLYGCGQALIVPNWLAGPSFLVPFALLVLARIGREERMLRSAFGTRWDTYAATTDRLLPFVW